MASYEITSFSLPSLATDQVERAVVGKDRFSWLHQDLGLRLSPAALKEYQNAKARGYVILRGKSHLANAWFHYCSSVQKPFIKVRARKNATVSLDMITTGRTLSSEAENRLISFVRQMWAETGTRRGTAIMGRSAWDISNVSQEFAVKCAEALLREAGG